MAQLIPKIEPTQIRNSGERDIVTALTDQLPNDCIIYHSHPWLKPERNDFKGGISLREGETDFVVIVPNAGILVLEVKGGTIAYDHDTQKWCRHEQNRIVQINNPFEQVRKNMHELERVLRERSFPREERLPFTYGYAVAFPHCDFSGPSPPGADTSIIFGASDLPHLGKRVSKALDKFRWAKTPNRMSASDIKAIKHGISPAFRLLPLLSRQIDQEGDQLVRLTDEQLRLIDFLDGRPRAAIQGVAGSGKTLLARMRAMKFADEGKKTLLVCFNRALADWINVTLPDDYADSIKVDTFHGLCSEWCKKARMKFSPKWKDDGTFWRETAPDLFVEALDVVADRFDAVVVDEGQDFYPNWWMPLEMINAQGDEGPFYIFYDPAQNLYVNERLSIPDVGEPFQLPTNCRNTRAIARTCGEILGVDIKVHDQAPDGEQPPANYIPSADKRVQSIRSVVQSWTGEGKLKPHQIAIIAPYEKSKTCLKETASLGKVKLTTNPNEWRADKGVLVSTAKAFKGLEADAVVITDVPDPEDTPYFSEADLYVACSRAKHRLLVLTTAKSVADGMK